MSQIALIVAYALGAAQGATATQDGSITLDQAISIAQTNAYSIQLQKSVVEQNQYRVDQAVGALGPQISLGANYTRFGSAITTQFGSGPPVVIQAIDQKYVDAQLTWQIDIMGNFRKQVAAQKANKAASAQTLNATFNDTRLNVRTAYFNVLRAQAQVTVDEDALKDAQGRLDQGQKQFAQQQVAKLDVTRYQSQEAQAESDLLSAKNSLTIAKYTLNLALARPIETPITAVDVTDLPTLGSSENQLVSAGQTKRPEVLSAQQHLIALHYITRTQEAGLEPTLNFSLERQHYFAPQGFSAQDDITTGVLALNIPIFDSGITRAKIRIARQDEVQAKITLEQTKLQISDDVRSAVENMQSAKARLDNATAQVGYAEEVFRLAKVKQDAGAGTYYEVIDAESQLTTARSGLVNARYDYLTSYSQLQRAVGTDDIAAAVAAAMFAPKGGNK